MNKIKNFKEKLFDKASKSGFSDCEIYYSAGEQFKVEIHKGEIEEYKNSYTKGVSFRGTYDGKMAYSYSERIDETVIDFLIEAAKKNGEILNPDEKEILYKGGEDYIEVITHDVSIDEASIDEKVKAALDMEKAAYEKSPLVISVDFCIVATGTTETYIANSYGLDLYNKSNNGIGYVSARVKKEDDVKQGNAYFVGRNWSKFSPEKLGEEAVEKALEQLGSKPVKSGKYKVVFEKDAANSLLAVFESNFHGDVVQKGLSLLKDKIGTKIASDVVTINDFADYKEGMGNTPFDSEGVPTMNNVLMEKGVLKTYLHNLKSAEKDGVESTGNGFKGSFKNNIEIQPTNFFIEPSNISFDNLLETMDKGLVITDLMGLHSGANSISGDFSLYAKGFYVEDGKIKSPVNMITVSGNFYEVLQDVEMVGDDLSFGTSIIGSPSLLIKELSISGE